MNKKLRAKRKLLGFNSSGDWVGMTYDELRMFADSFVQPVNFATEEAISSAVSAITDTLIWVGLGILPIGYNMNLPLNLKAY